MADNDNDNNDNTDDIDRWLKLLGGKHPEGEPADDDWQAIALREALLRDAEQADAQAGDSEGKQADDHAWQRLAFRLRREGLLPAQRKPLAQPWVPVAAAALLMLGIGVNVYQQAPGDQDFAVGDSQAPQYRAPVPTIGVPAVRPVPSARRLGSALQRLDVQPRLYAQGADAVLDIEVPADKVDDVKAVLEANGVAGAKVGAGLVRIVFRARSQSTP